MSLLQRMDRIERRMARVEARLAIETPVEDLPPALVEKMRTATAGVAYPPATAPSATPRPAPPMAPPPLPTGARSLAVDEPTSPRDAALAAVAMAFYEPARATTTQGTAPERGPEPSRLLSDDASNPPVASAAEAVLAYAAPLPPVPPPQSQLEQTIGLKLAGWIGAVVLVIGAGLGIKFAYDQGWLASIPPAARLVLMSMGGFALIGAGEIVLRRVNVVAAAAVFGAGVATLYFVSHAGHAYYRLYEPTTAFVFMGLTTVIGAAVALRGRMLSIAVLSLVGGNLAPLVLEGDTNLLVPFLTYLAMLQIVALALAWWGGSDRWWTLRGLSLATLALWLSNVLFETHGHTNTLLLFVCAYWLLFHLELVLSAFSSRRRDAGEASDIRTGSEVTFSVLVTAGLTLAGLFILRDASDATRAALLIATAVGCAIVATAGRLIGGRGLIPLARSLVTQAAGLVILAVPIAMDGPAVSLTWAAMALVFAVVGMMLDEPIARIAGGITWAFAAVNAVAIYSVGEREAVALLTTSWFTFTSEMALVAALVILGHVVGHLIHRGIGSGGSRAEWINAARMISVLASALFVAEALRTLDVTAATVALVAYAWALALLDSLDRELKLLGQAGVLLVATVLKWVAVDTLAERFSAGWIATQDPVLFNPTMTSGLLVIASLAGLFWIRQRAWLVMLNRSDEPSSQRRALLGMGAIVIVLMGFALSVEIDHVIEQRVLTATQILWPVLQYKLLGWTILWTLACGAYLGLAHVVERDPAERAPALRSVTAWLILLSLLFIVLDTLGWRLMGRVAPVIAFANVQAMAAALLIAGLAGMCVLSRHAGTRVPRRGAAFFALLLFLYAATLEIDRYFTFTTAGWIANPPLFKQVALSIFWSLSAIGCVMAGFRVRVTGLRYAGLALFAVTLLKVVLIDLADAQTGYRILSFIGLGLLLLGTSVLYGKLSPRLLQAGRS